MPLGAAPSASSCAKGSSALAFFKRNASISSAVTFSPAASSELNLRLLASPSSAARSRSSSFLSASLT